jgi:hypothetical protein
VKWDGTFDFLKKTKDYELAEDENDCLHIVWGDYGHVLAWAMSLVEISFPFRSPSRCSRVLLAVSRTTSSIAYSTSTRCSKRTSL